MLMDMNVIISPWWYGVCDIYVAEGVLTWTQIIMNVINPTHIHTRQYSPVTIYQWHKYYITQHNEEMEIISMDIIDDSIVINLLHPLGVTPGEQN